MLHGWIDDVPGAIKAARLSALRAVDLGDQNVNAHGILGMALTFSREFDDGEHHLARAIGLNPNLAIGHGNFAAIHGIIGNFDKAVISCDRAIALSPRDPLKAFWRDGVGIGAFVAEDYQACVDNARKGLKETPGYASLLRQEAVALGMMGRREEGAAAIANLLQSMPDLTISQVRNMVPVRNPEDWDRWLEGLRRSGLPE